VCHAIAVAQEKYSDYDDAMIAAARFLRKNDYPSAVPPLEAALTLAKDDAQRLKVYQALVPAYRQQPEIDKLLTAQEFIIRHTDRKAGRSLAARDVTSFAYQRGKLDAVTERYDAQFAQDPKDPAALTILNSIYSQTKRNDRRTPLLKQELDALDRELAATFAQRLENEAQAAPKTTAWLLKDAAAAWLEAGDNPKALASAKKSAAAAPEARTTQLTHMWHEGLGDVFLKAGEPQLAVAQFEAAIAVAPYDSAREAVQKKLAEARGTAVSK
jgi:hypothetical protein